MAQRNLGDLAPSISPLANTDRAPADYPDPDRRLTILSAQGHPYTHMLLRHES